MKRRILFFIGMALVSISFTGCWTRRELTDMSFIFSRGFDIDENGEYISTSQILDTGKETAGGGAGGNRGLNFFIIMSKGRTAFSTSRNGARESGRRLFSAQSRVIVIGERAARAGILTLVDHWNRDIDTVPTTNILITSGEAAEIVKMQHPAEDIPGMAVAQLIKVNYATSRVATIELYELMRTITSKTSASYVPGIEIAKHEDGSQSLRLNRTAILKKDKLVGWFNDNESRGLLWILGKVKTGEIEVLSPTSTEKELDIMALKILKQSMKKVEPKIEDGKLNIKIKVKTDCIIANVADAKINLDKEDIIKELEKRAEAQVRNDIQAAIDKGQKEYNADVFNFDDAFHHKYPKEWKSLESNWDTEFRNIHVEQEVEVKILRSGLMSSYDEDEE